MRISDIIFRNRIAVCSLVFMFVMAGCNHSDDGVVRSSRSIDSIMDQAENTMDDDAAFADSLMRLIDPYSIKGANRKARYALLYTAAEYKNYQLLTSDSLIMEAVRYYSIRNNMDYRFLSYYYLGCAYIDMGQMMDASVALVQAEQMVDKIDNDYWKGLLFSQLGSLYYKSCEFLRSEEYYRRSEKCFDSAGKELHKAYALFDYGDNKICLKEFNVVDSIMQIVEKESILLGDSMLYVESLYNRVLCYVYLKEPERAKRLIEKYEFDIKSKKNTISYLSMMALYYNSIKDYERSESYLNEAWTFNLSKDDSIYLYYVGYILTESKGEINESLSCFEKYFLLQDESIRDLLNQPIEGPQRDYFRAVSELEAMKARNRVTILFACIFVFVLIVAIILLINLNHRRKVQQEIRDYLSTIDDLTARESVNKSKISLLNGQVRDMLRQQFTHSDYLYTRYYEQIDDNKKAERLFRVVKTQIDQFTAPKSISRIDELLNKTFDGIMDKLSSSGLELREKELMLLRFVLAGFSAKSIAAILDDTNVNITQRKKRLLDKIQNKAPNIMDELRNALSVK